MTQNSARLVLRWCFTLLLAMNFCVPPANAKPKFKVLHTFHGKDGVNPIGQLIGDAAGNFYGTTGEGGSGRCQNFGCGTAFKMNAAGKILWQYSFQGPNGEGPSAGLLRDSTGNFFGTTEYGGKISNHLCLDIGGCGVVFELDKDGRKETARHKFTGPPDGYVPESLLVGDAAGNLYGTTYIGGNGYGTVFKVDNAGKETILYNFTGGSDGCAPYPGVVRDGAGNLYGVTLIGGAGFCNSGYGVVFMVDPSGNETVLHTFSGSDGANPISVLLFDKRGNLYGTTENGGVSTVCGGGCGTVFELSPSGGGWSETVLYSFCPQSGCTDGETPFRGPLVRDARGNIYGTTEMGGASSHCNGAGCGVVFKLDAGGKEMVLHSFTGGADGAYPYGGLVIDSAGNLYGAVLEGGDLKCSIGNGRGCGTVFKISF